MKQSGVASLLYVSSICVYGLDPTLGSPVNESSGFGQTFLPYDYYGLAKIAAEKSVAAAHQAGHIQATVVRPGWFYGSHDEGSYGRLATRTRQRLLLKVGSGENRLPLVYVGNVADILYQCLARPSRDYRVYLYAADGPITQNEYLASLARASGSTQKPITVSQSLLLKVALLQEVAYVWSRYWLPTWQTRQFVHLWGSDWSFDQRLVTQELGYQAQVGYEAGLAATEAWYQNRHQAG